jgi:hypothetical protein
MPSVCLIVYYTNCHSENHQFRVTTSQIPKFKRCGKSHKRRLRSGGIVECALAYTNPEIVLDSNPTSVGNFLGEPGLLLILWLRIKNHQESRIQCHRSTNIKQPFKTYNFHLPNLAYKILTHGNTIYHQIQ